MVSPLGWVSLPAYSWTRCWLQVSKLRVFRITPWAQHLLYSVSSALLSLSSIHIVEFCYEFTKSHCEVVVHVWTCHRLLTVCWVGIWWAPRSPGHPCSPCTWAGMAPWGGSCVRPAVGGSQCLYLAPHLRSGGWGMAASRGLRCAVLIADEVQHLSTSSSAVGVLWF